MDPWGLNPAWLLNVENYILSNLPQVTSAMTSAIEYGGNAFGGTHPNALGMAYIGRHELLNALVQANQTLGECILDSAEYLVMEAPHDVINNIIPFLLDTAEAGGQAVIGLYNAPTKFSVPQSPGLYWEQGAATR